MIDDNVVLAGKLSNKQKALSFILLFPAYLFYIPTIINFLIKLYINNTTDKVDYALLGVWLNLSVGLLSLVLAVFILKDFIADNFRAFKEKLLENVIWSCSVGIGILYGASIVANILVNLLLGSKGADGSANQQLFELLLSNNLIIMAIQAVILAPIVEELLFRGVIFRSLRKYGLLIAHIVSALLFGFLHIYSALLNGDMTQLIQMIPYVAMGFVFSYSYEKRGNIGSAILLHMLNNLIAVALSIITAKI